MGERVGEQEQVDKSLAALGGGGGHPLGHVVPRLVSPGRLGPVVPAPPEQVEKQVPQRRVWRTALGKLGDQFAGGAIDRGLPYRRSDPPRGPSQLRRIERLIGFPASFLDHRFVELVE